MTKIDEVVARFFTDANKFLPSGTAIKPIAPDQLRAILQEVHDAAVAECGKDAELWKFVRAEHDRIDPICRVSWKMFGIRNSTNWGNVVNGNELESMVKAAIAAAMRTR